MRTFLTLLFSVLLIGNVPAFGAYKPSPRAAPVAAEVSSVEAPRSVVKKTGHTRAERRLQKILHRIHRALPEEGEGRFDINSLLAGIFGVVSLIGLFIFPYLAVLCIPAVILGIIGLGKTGPERLRGKGLAIAGIATGALAFLISLAAFIALVLLIAFLF